MRVFQSLSCEGVTPGVRVNPGFRGNKSMKRPFWERANDEPLRCKMGARVNPIVNALQADTGIVHASERGHGDASSSSPEGGVSSAFSVRSLWGGVSSQPI